MSVHSLDGDWLFRAVGPLRGGAPRDTGLLKWMRASMPGTIHFHLQKTGKIPDPFDGRNELAVQWVDEQDWELVRTVRVSPEDRACARQELLFDGIDTVAEVFLNGKRIGRSFNMFRPLTLDVRGKLGPGPNEVRVLLKSPTRYARSQARSNRYRADTDGEFKWETGEARESRRAWIRKVQCHFGWDWGLYLAVSGLWRSTRLECSNAPRIASLQTRQVHQGPEGNPRRVALRVRARLESAQAQRGTFTVRCGGREARVRAVLKSGENLVEAGLVLDHPKLWWPAGQGDQPLYHLEAVWEGEDAETARLEKRLGLRTLELVTAKDRSAEGVPGESFFFKVNGRPVFMKGANWIPADAFIDRCTKERYRHLLASMVESHMNMVRVWGGGQYEMDVFYDLCDELGLLVWQDFMMACAVYPDTTGFLRELESEARCQVRRLSDHACVAVWCGDNENLSGLRHWWPRLPGGPRYPRMYRRVSEVLRRTCFQEDPGRRFWTSSPSNGSLAGDPDDPRRGDVHYWKVWHGGRPFSDYLSVEPRFASEFGFQSFPEPRTLEAVVPPAERNPSSWFMEHHQRSAGGNLLIANTLAREMPLPRDFESFCLASQVNQAQAIRTAVEHWRRLRPWCMGTLYWQVNDLWPVASWSSIDYHGRWKVLHHEAGRFFAPLLVSLEKGKDEISVWATNDLPRALRLRGSLESVTWAGKRVAREGLAARLGPGESRRLLTIPFSRLLRKGMHPREVVCRVGLEGGGATGMGEAPLVPWKWAPVEKPRVLALLRQGKGGIELCVRSRNPVPFFHAELKGEEGHFTGDWRMLWPGHEHVFQWVPHRSSGGNAPTLGEARKRLRTLSLYDLSEHPKGI